MKLICTDLGGHLLQQVPQTGRHRIQPIRLSLRPRRIDVRINLTISIHSRGRVVGRRNQSTGIIVESKEIDFTWNMVGLICNFIYKWSNNLWWGPSPLRSSPVIWTRPVLRSYSSDRSLLASAVDNHRKWTTDERIVHTLEIVIRLKICVYKTFNLILTWNTICRTAAASCSGFPLSCGYEKSQFNEIPNFPPNEAYLAW